MQFASPADTIEALVSAGLARITAKQARLRLFVKDGVVLYEKGALLDKPDATWTTNKAGLFAIANKDEEAISKLVTQTGDETLLPKLLEGVTGFSDAKYFNIAEP